MLPEFQCGYDAESNCYGDANGKIGTYETQSHVDLIGEKGTQDTYQNETEKDTN